MALRLRQAVSGQPSHDSSQNTSVIVAGTHGYVVYPSTSNVIVVSPSLDLADTLEFWPALRHRASSSKPGKVQGVVCSTPDGLILAWSDVHVVLWSHQQSKDRVGGGGSWLVHSTIVASSPITCLDFRAGNLALGTQKGIEYWRMDPTAEVVVWDRLWERASPEPASIRLSPTLGHIAWYITSQRSAHILTLDRKGQAAGIAQEVRHPREITWIGWRQTLSESGDSHLYTITTNSVFRIYSTVLDDPMWFQLLLSLDHRAFSCIPPALPEHVAKGKEPQSNPFGVMWAWDAEVLRAAVKAELGRIEGADEEGRSGLSEGLKAMEGMKDDESDVIVWVGPDGTVALRSIVNTERKPPTLLRSLPLASFKLPPASPPTYWSPYAQLLHIPDSPHSLTAVLPPTPHHPHITSLHLSLPRILSSKPGGVTSSTIAPSSEETTEVQLVNPISHFVRTPNGRGLLAIASHGEIAVWYKQQLGVRPSRWQSGPKSLVGKGHWSTPTSPSQAVIFSKGRAIVLYTDPPAPAPATITLQHLDTGKTAPCEPVTLPHFSPTDGDKVEMLLAVSDIDDGFSGRGRRTHRAIIMAATRSGEAWVWRVNSRISPEETAVDERPEVFLLSHYRLPLHGGGDEPPRLILPVDPMGWHQSVIDWGTDTPMQDMILTVSADGDLEFWTPRIGQHLAGEESRVARADRACEVDANGKVNGKANGNANGNGHAHGVGGDDPWTRTGLVRTGRSKVVNARCSSRKKTVLVCELDDGRNEMTIWDSKVSEFSTGLELTQIYGPGEEIQDLDWTTTSDLQSVLAVGFAHRVVLICEQRMSYVETAPGWAPFLSIDLSPYTSVAISDSVWLAGGSLAVGAGNQIYLFSRFLESDSPAGTPVGTPVGAPDGEEGGEEPEDIFQLIALQNGPLLDYHPIVLAQCLLWDKADLAKSILLRLVKDLKECEDEGRKRLSFKRLDPSEFYSTRKASKTIKSDERKYDGLFDSAPVIVEEDEDEFTEKVVADLVDRLHGHVHVPLSVAEKSFLATVAQATLEAEQQRRSLDLCGMRYLISIRMYVNWDRLSATSGTTTPANGASTVNVPGASGRGRKHLSFRNIVWAMHSDSQELLLEAATQCCPNGKMVWPDAKRLGVFLWLKSADTAKSQLEIIARNRFMADEERDPTTCSLIFFALNKKKVVHGLWRQAPGHSEQKLMLKFLANDFTLDRWKTAAMKNAYALLSKQRYEYAAAFFMLAGQAKDAINVCLRQLDDWQLGLALARVVEGGTEGPIFKWIIVDTVLPVAFKGGHRWLATWGFWMLGRRDLAVRVLISPMNDVVQDYTPDKPLEVGNPDNDDPSLLLMFQHLKSKSLQTAKGASEISPKFEFDFVLHNARVFFRMGCHNLALDLCRSWSFDRPFFPTRRRPPSNITTPLPLAASTTFSSSFAPSIVRSDSTSLAPPYLGHHKRRPSFLLASASGHLQGSLFMDMDVLAESEDSSRMASPLPVDRRLPETGSGAASPRTSNVDEKVPAIPPFGENIVVDEPVTLPGTVEEAPASAPPSAQPRKIGNLMKDLKQDVQQGGMEFNMDNFF